MRTEMSLRRSQGTISSINMVPFIDVMLVLLIIFMVTAPLLTPALIDLPSVGKAADKPQEIVQIEIGRDEKMLVKAVGVQVSVNLDALLETVQKAQVLVASHNASNQGQSQASLLPQQVPVVISADKNIKYDAVMRAMDSLQRAGIERVGLAVQLDGNEAF